MEKTTITLNSQQVELLKMILEEFRKEKISASSAVISGMILDKVTGVKKEECEQGHTCSSGCQKDFDCPCLSDHCCSMTPKEDLCGEVEDCEFCNANWVKNND